MNLSHHCDKNYFNLLNDIVYVVVNENTVRHACANCNMRLRNASIEDVWSSGLSFELPNFGGYFTQVGCISKH